MYGDVFAQNIIGVLNRNIINKNIVN